MNRKQLHDELKRLAEKAKVNGHLAEASMLLGILSASLVNEQNNMVKVVSNYMEKTLYPILIAGKQSEQN